MSQWGWHTKPLPETLKDQQFKPTEYDSYGRKVPYITGKTGQEELYDWLRENPHRLHLGQIGFEIRMADGQPAKPADITGIEQTLDLWSGFVLSRFKVDGLMVSVKTAVHPTFDTVAFAVESDLVELGRLKVRIAFPYGSQSMQAADWTAGASGVEPETGDSTDPSRA